MPLVRCMHYDDDGKAIGKGCYNVSRCDFVHPSEPRWDQAKRRAMAHGGNKDRGRDNRGPPRGSNHAPKAPRAMTNFDVPDWNADKVQSSSSSSWGAPRPSVDWGAPAKASWNDASAGSNDWNSAPAPWGGSSNEESASSWTNGPSVWDTPSVQNTGGWGTEQSAAPNDSGWGASANKTESTGGWGTEQSATTSDSGWGTSANKTQNTGGWGSSATTKDASWGDSANKTDSTKDIDMGSTAEGTSSASGWGAAPEVQTKAGVTSWGASEIQTNTDIEMGSSDASTGGWGNTGSMGPPPPPQPTAMPPTPPVSGGFSAPLRISLPERKSPPPEPSPRNVFSTRTNPLKRKFDEPSTPISPCTSTAPTSLDISHPQRESSTSSLDTPHPHKDAAILAVNERLRAEDAASAVSRSPSLMPLQLEGSSSPNVGGESKSRKEVKLISKLTRSEQRRMWHNHLKTTLRALNACRKLNEAESQLQQCDSMIQSGRYRQLGISAKDVLNGQRTACKVEIDHKKKYYDNALEELVKDEERFDIPPQDLFRGSDQSTQRKLLAELKRYLESARSWMETTNAEIETLREAREQAQRQEAVAAPPPTWSSPDPGPSVHNNTPSTSAADSSSKYRKVSSKLLKRMDELETQLANAESEFDSYSNNVEEKVRDQVEGALEHLELPTNDLDEDMEDVENHSDAASQDLEELVKEVGKMRAEIAELKQIAADTQTSADVDSGVLRECRVMVEELRVKEGELSGDLSATRLARDEMQRVLDEARQHKSEMEAAVEDARRRHEEVANDTSAVAALVEATLAPLLSSVKQAILPEVEKVTEVLAEDVEKKMAQANAEVISAVWEKVEAPLQAAKRMASHLNLNDIKRRPRAPSLTSSARPAVPFPFLTQTQAASQPKNGVQ